MEAATYADVNGVHMFYEVGGQGDPLVLLHGGLGGAHIFGNQVPAFVESHRVFVPEMRGHGHTPDVVGPITYQVMGDDVVEFIDREVGEPVHVVGMSDGGIVGLLVALERPELLRKLVTVGSNFNGDGLLDAGFWTDASADDEAWSEPREHHGQVSPDGPDHFPVVFEKVQRMWRDGQPQLTTGDLARIEIPVLVMVGDDDVVDHHHTIELYEALSKGQLAVIPGASHAVIMDKPGPLNRMVLDFLSEDQGPSTLLPVRRAR